MIDLLMFFMYFVIVITVICSLSLILIIVAYLDEFFTKKAPNLAKPVFLFILMLAITTTILTIMNPLGMQV